MFDELKLGELLPAVEISLLQDTGIDRTVGGHDAEIIRCPAILQRYLNGIAADSG